MISVLRNWESNPSHSKSDHWIRKRFVVIELLESRKLAYREDASAAGESTVIHKASADIGSIKVLIGAENIFEILSRVHEATCHGKTRITWEKAKQE